MLNYLAETSVIEIYCLTLHSGIQKMNQKQKEKGADLLLDIIKYIITAVVLTTLFGDFAKWEWYWYVIVAAIILLMTSISISVYKEDNKKKK